jgi:hypothetical protein
MTPTKIEKRTLVAGSILILVIAATALTAAVAGAAERAAVISTTVTPNATQTVTVVSTPSTASVNSTSVVSGKGTFALDFTLPTFGKSGCLVCHADKNLVVAKGDVNVSYWIDEAAYSHSAHATVICTGCHVDYGYKSPHGQGEPTTGRPSRSRPARTATRLSTPTGAWALTLSAPSPSVSPTRRPLRSRCAVTATAATTCRS